MGVGLHYDVEVTNTEVFFKIGVLKNFAIFTGKHFNKIAVFLIN